MFGNPVMWVELSRLAARKRQWLRKSPQAVLGLAVFAAYVLLRFPWTRLTPGEWGRYLRMAPAFGLWMYASIGISYGSWMGAELLKEFQRRTFELLSVTALEPRNILWGKLQAQMVGGLLYALLFLPLWAVACALAGWPWYWLPAGPAMAVASTFFFGAVSLCGVVIVSMANLTVLLPAVLGVLLGLSIVWGVPVGNWLVRAALVTVPAMVVGGLVLFWVAEACLPWRLRCLVEGTASPAVQPKVRPRLFRRKPRTIPLGSYDDPFVWQEARRPMWTRAKTCILFGGLTLPFLAIGALAGELEVAGGVAAGAVAGGGALLVPLLSVGSVFASFEAERTKRTVEGLILTGRPPEDILRGKLRAWQRSVLPVAAIPAVTAVAVVLVLALGVGKLPAGLGVLLFLLGAVFPWYGMRLALLTGMVAGITCRSAKQAGQLAAVGGFVPWLVVLWVERFSPVVPGNAIRGAAVVGAGLLTATFWLGRGARGAESWRPWRLGLALLGEALLTVGVVLLLAEAFGVGSVGFGLAAAGAVCALGFLTYRRWWKLAVRTFEAGMLQPVSQRE